jgi:hypothetical protein
MMIYLDSNIEQETTVRVMWTGGPFSVQLFDGLAVDMTRLVGTSIVRDRADAVKYARQIVAGVVLLGDWAPL